MEEKNYFGSTRFNLILGVHAKAGRTPITSIARKRDWVCESGPAKALGFCVHPSFRAFLFAMR